MWKIDYHIHTIYSDGASTPSQIVKAAKSMGLEAIAITDHDGIDGVREAIKQGEESGIKVITGIEFATITKDGLGLHLLGYDFDPQHPVLQDKLDYMNEERDKRNVRLIKVLQEMGYDITYEELRYARPNNFIGKPVIARAFVQKGYIDNYKQAFEPGKILGSPQAKAVRKEKVDVIDAIRTINMAGGKAVLAHPIQTKPKEAPDDDAFYDKVDSIVAELTTEGLYGLECYHPDQNEAQTLRFLKMAEKYKLRVSRGTDFHDDDFTNNPRPTPECLSRDDNEVYGRFPEEFIV